MRRRSDSWSDSRSGDPGNRAVSTVLDVGLCLLLVSAAVGVLYAAPTGSSDDGGDVAASGATTLATSTATVEYTPTAGDASSIDRGTVASLLARAALANATVDGASLTSDDAYVDAVRARTRRALAGVSGDARVRASAHWRPLPGSGLRSRVAVGPRPPPDADVHAATLAVPVGAGRAGESDAGASLERSLPAPARQARCSSVGRTIARRTVRSVFPPDRTTAALQSDAARSHTSERYRTAAAGLGADPAGVDRGGTARDRNAVLVERLSPRLVEQCRAADEPLAWARAATPGRVTVVVRTWSP